MFPFRRAHSGWGELPPRFWAEDDWPTLSWTNKLSVSRGYGVDMSACATGGSRGLPRPLTSFIGRAAEIDQLRHLLGDHRLITVTGPGGVGKTRLASEVAWLAADGFADGAFLVELAGVTDPSLVALTVATAVGVQQIPGTATAKVMADALARQQVLLVLDNCEHVLATAAELCRALLEVADDVRILATSREPLGITGEARFRVRPLPVPEAPAQPGEDMTPSVALFADRARLMNPDFVLDARTMPLAERVVARLDGVPLAIELAAAHVEALGLGQMMERLEVSFRLLTGADRGAPPRHRSLAATVEWSYQLLDESEQDVFRRVSIFPSPFTLEAATAVAGPEAESAVLRLVECSLLAPPRTGPDGRDRYPMLETLRAFGRDRLAAAAEFHETSVALARYATAVAERATASMETAAGELAGALQFDAEDAVLRQVLTWALDHDPPTALKIATAQAPWHILRGRAADSYRLLKTAAVHAAPPDPAWHITQFWLGQFALYSSDFTAALDHFTAAADAPGEAAHSPVRTLALCGRANILLLFGRLAEATEQALNALERARFLGDRTAEVFALLNMTGIATHAGDFAQAVQWARQACQIDPAEIRDDCVRDAHRYLALALIQAGDLSAALDSCGTALALARDVGDQDTESFCMLLLADIELQSGDMAGARGHLPRALLIATRRRDKYRDGELHRVRRRVCCRSWTGDRGDHAAQRRGKMDRYSRLG